MIFCAAVIADLPRFLSESFSLISMSSPHFEKMSCAIRE
jgi:hypothetical protein